MAESSEDAPSSEADPRGNEESETEPGGKHDVGADGNLPDQSDGATGSETPGDGSTEASATEEVAAEGVISEGTMGATELDAPAGSDETDQVDKKVQRSDLTYPENAVGRDPAGGAEAQSTEESVFPPGDAPSEPDDSVSSIAGRAKPALAERQALVAVAGAMGIGVGGAVVGVLLDMTIKDVKFVLALGGLLILTMAAFVLFRAMLSAAERNEEPAKTALTHPLFMLLFVVLATATALFIGLLRMAYWAV
jgi:hypothetical protein